MKPISIYSSQVDHVPSNRSSRLQDNRQLRFMRHRYLRHEDEHYVRTAREYCNKNFEERVKESAFRDIIPLIMVYEKAFPKAQS